jgi:hypothetical protein
VAKGLSFTSQMGVTVCASPRWLVKGCAQDRSIARLKRLSRPYGIACAERFDRFILAVQVFAKRLEVIP